MIKFDQERAQDFLPIFCFDFVYIRVTTIDTQGGIVSQSSSLLSTSLNTSSFDGSVDPSQVSNHEVGRWFQVH